MHKEMTREIQGKKFKLLISSTQISKRVKELGAEITNDYKGNNPVLVGILKGAFVFLSDLIKNINLNIKVDFVRVSTYKEGMKSGDIDLIMDLSVPIKNQDVIIIEDIIDTGITLKFIRERVISENPASCKICTLVDIKERRKVDIQPDYIGFEIQRGFIIGYGADFAENGRNLPDIFITE